jgi:N-acetylglucosamine-6-phosphate deacetylase
MKKITLFRNFDVVRGGSVHRGCTVAVSDGKILSVGDDSEIEDAEIIDGRGENYLLPGFIDLHVHGGGGFEFMDGDAAEYKAISNFHASHGTTAHYPTTLSASREELLASVRAFDEAAAAGGGAKMLGIHLEGPYIAKSQKGAMDEKYIRDPIKEEYEELLAVSSNIRRMTIAPELPGAVELGAFLSEKGILPSIGHTDCVCEDVIDAYTRGSYRLMTHLYSAMSQTRRIGVWRRAGAVEAAYLLDGMYVEIIADGIHLPPELLKLIYKIKGSGRIALITDSMRGSGTAQGTQSILGSRKNGLPCWIEDGVAKTNDRTAFAGSIATSDRLLRNMVYLAGVSLPEASRMASETPAEIMGIKNSRGSIDAGKYADLVVMDRELRIRRTVVEGETVFEG